MMTWPQWFALVFVVLFVSALWLGNPDRDRPRDNDDDEWWNL